MCVNFTQFVYDYTIFMLFLHKNYEVLFLHNHIFSECILADQILLTFLGEPVQSA